MSPPDSLWNRRLAWAGLGLIALLAAAYVGRWGMAFAGGSDEAGYVHNAWLLQQGRLTEPTRPIPGVETGTFRPQVYESLGRVASPDGLTLRPYYPFGYPIVIVVANLLDGPAGDGVWLALVGMIVAVPFLVYALGRELGLNRAWAVVAATAMTFSPMTIFMAVRPMSDLFTMLLAVAAVLAARRAHRGWGWAAALGLLFSWAVFTRAPNTILAVPLAVAWLARWREQRWWWVTIVAGLPTMAVVMAMNHRLFGSPWRTGYGRLDVLFSREFVGPSLANYAASLPVVVPPLLLAAAAVSVVGLWRAPRRYLLLWVWTLTFAGFYAFYRHTQEVWWYLRFVLPMLPAIVIAGSLILQSWTDRLPTWARFFPIYAVLVLGLGWNALQVSERVYPYDPKKEAYVLLGPWLRAETDPDDVFLCTQASGSLFHQLPNPIARYEHLRPGDWEILRTATASAGVDIYAVLWDYEVAQRRVLEDVTPGDWEFLQTLNSARIYRLRRGSEPADQLPGADEGEGGAG